MSDRKYDPRGSFDIVLSVFADYPEDQRPTFTYRRLSVAEWDQLDDEAEKLSKLASNKEYRSRIVELSANGLIGWDKQVDIETGAAVPFDVTQIHRVINHDDAMELCAQRKDHCAMTFVDKKKLKLQL